MFALRARHIKNKKPKDLENITWNSMKKKEKINKILDKNDLCWEKKWYRFLEAFPENDVALWTIEAAVAPVFSMIVLKNINIVKKMMKIVIHILKLKTRCFVIIVTFLLTKIFNHHRSTTEHAFKNEDRWEFKKVEPNPSLTTNW